MERRRLLTGGATLLSLASLNPWALAQALSATPAQARGPFYPTEFPSDKDSNLVQVAGSNGVAYGEITNVSGRVLDLNGKPLAGVRVEIWQVNGYGRYHHEGDDQDKPIDPNFQGYGEATSAEGGTYSFRTVKPVAYPGRAPHIHFVLTPATGRPLTTQMYLAGAPENESDFLLSRVRDQKLRDRLIVPLEKVTGGGELEGKFDIVMPFAA